MNQQPEEKEMSKELSLPLTGDGTGYLKEDVEQHVALEQDKARKIIDKAQQLLLNAEQRSNEIVANAETEASNIQSSLDGLRAKATEDIEKSKNAILQKAEDDSRKKVAASEKKASHIIEEAMSKVHALVKTAQTKLETAKKDAKTLELESASKYADAISNAGKLVLDAEEYTQNEIVTANKDAENIRLEAETMLAYAQEESRIIVNAAQVEANSIADEAASYQQEVAVWAETELEAAREKFEKFKAYYDDRVSRLNAMHQTSLEEIRILSSHEFSDGSHLKVNDNFKQKVDESKKDTNTKVDAKPVVVPVEVVEETPEADEKFINLEHTSVEAPDSQEQKVLVYDESEDFIISDSQSEQLEEIMGSLSTFDDDDSDNIIIVDEEKK